MAENTIVLSDDSSSEESSSAPPAFATKSTASSSSQEPPRRNIAVKKGVSTPQPVGSGLGIQQKNKSDLKTLQFSSNFLDNFNPQNSRREKNKRRTQQHVHVKQAQPKKIYNYTAIYDEQGKLKANGKDICDCFELSCPGCHFPCYVCGSNKCSIRCRNNRKFMYEAIEHDGKDFVINNPHLALIMN